MSSDPPKPQNFLPPQPVNSGPPRFVIVIAIVIVVALLALVVIFALNFLDHGPNGAPTTPPQTPSQATPAPTVAGSPRPSFVSSHLPPTARTSTPPSSPGTPAAELLTHVPEALRATCTEATAASSPGIEMAMCSASSGAIAVTYSLYASTELMNAAYEDQFAQVEIDPSSGACEDPSTWPAEGGYQVQATPAGRVLCTNAAGVPNIVWTDDQLTIMSSATSTSGDAAGLVQFWLNEAGPTP